MNLRDQVNGWLSTFTRAVGIAGLIWEVIVDKFHHPEALGIFGGLAGLPDILAVTTNLRKPPGPPAVPGNTPETK